MIDSKKLINDIINNLDNFERLMEIHNASNEAKLLAGDLNNELDKLDNYLTMIKEFLESNKSEYLLDFDINKLLDDCNKVIAEIEEYKNEIKKNYEYLINLESVVYEDAIDIYKSIDKIEEEIYLFLRNIRRLSDEMDMYINRYSIDRRFQNKIRKLKNFRKKLDEHYEGLTKFHNTIESIRDKYRNINSYLAQYSNSQQIIEESYILPILTNLKAGLYDGLYGIDVLNYMTGLYGISANPVSELIFLKIDDERPKPYSLESLFYRYPPFEPVAVKDERGVIGNKIWFIKPKNGRFASLSFKDDDLQRAEVIKGEIKKEHVTNKLKSVEFVDLFGDDTNKYVLIILENHIRLKYGSGRLKNYLSQRKSIEEIEKIYKEYMLGHNHKKGYSPTNLSYIWFCRWGRGMSTDPWDIDCPFKNYCGIWRIIRSRTNRQRCPLWSWSRRQYPKVFPVSKRKTPNKNLEFSESFNGIIPIYGRGVLIKDEYSGVQFNIPGGMYPINIEFETPIGKELAKTNVVGIAIDKKFIKTIIFSLLNEDVSNYTINLFGVEVSISNIVLSKCFLMNSTNKGLKMYSLLERDFEYIIKKYNTFKKEYKTNRIRAKEVIENATYILLHTLAHLLLGFLSKELEVKSEDLLYLVDETEEYYRVLIAENSPIGALDIIGAIKDKFGSLTNMVIKFLESSYNLLKEHEKQLKSYEEVILRRIDRFRQLSEKNQIYSYNIKIIEELKKHYSEFLKHGLVLDLYYFNTYMQLKRGDNTGYGKYGDLIDLIVEDKTINERLRREINNIFTLAFPTYCIDGCISCTMFDKGCFDGLGQSITTSKELTKVFIEIVLKGREFRGYGNIVLRNVIESLCKEELIALSPYIDEEGIKFLDEMSKKGISVKLIINKKMIDNFNELLRECEFEVYIMKSNHDKAYYIDNKILLTSTANLTLKSDSINRFGIFPTNKNPYKIILERAEKWKK